MLKDNNKIIFHNVTLAILCSIILVAVGLTASKMNARSYDFAAYWQAGYMLIHGNNIYNPNEWMTVRTEQKTALHSEVIFQYPLPLAVLMTPLAKLSIDVAYFIWTLFGLAIILVSVLLLFRLDNKKSSLIEIMLLGIIFLFRPMYTVIFSGQVLSLLLFLIVLSILFFEHKRWFIGGFFLAFVTLKPSIGLPILLICGIWMVIYRLWKSIAGVMAGGLFIWGLGAIYDIDWVVSYLNASKHILTKYMGMHTTIWGLITLFWKESLLSYLFAGLGIGIVIALIIGIFKAKTMTPFVSMSIILPAGLLIAPYSWSYDQILLIVPLIFVVNEISKRYSNNLSLIFMAGFMFFSALFVLLASELGHDVLSIFVTGLLWSITIFLVVTKKPIGITNDVYNSSDEK